MPPTTTPRGARVATERSTRPGRTSNATPRTASCGVSSDAPGAKRHRRRTRRPDRTVHTRGSRRSSSSPVLTSHSPNDNPLDLTLQIHSPSMLLIKQNITEEKIECQMITERTVYLTWRKFSAVLGTTSERSCIVRRPSGFPSISISKNTWPSVRGGPSRGRMRKRDLHHRGAPRDYQAGTPSSLHSRPSLPPRASLFSEPKS